MSDKKKRYVIMVKEPGLGDMPCPPVLWREVSKDDGTELRFIDPGAAYNFAKANDIDPCTVLKVHGTQTLEVKTVGKRELF